MAQHKINATKTNWHQANFVLVGLLWLAFAAFGQAAGKDPLGNAKMAARPANTIGAAVASGGSDLFLYNPSNGSATYGTLYADGHFLTSAYHTPNTWSRGWSHIVRSNGILFFYRQSDGFWATSRASQNGYTITLRSGYTGLLPQRYYGFMHVVSTPNGILICRGSSPLYPGESGAGIVGQVGSDGSFRVTYSGIFYAWAQVVNTPNGLVFWSATLGSALVGVGRIQPNGAFVQTFGSYLPGTWPWSELVAVGNDLILFPYAVATPAIPRYPRTSGAYRVAGISSTGQFVLRNTLCSPALAGGYIVSAVIGNNLFLYAVEDTSLYNPSDLNPADPTYKRLVQSGWAMVANFRGSDYYYFDPSCKGKLNIRQEYPEGSFAAGWSTIVNTANGVFFYNPNTGALMVGSFAVDGSFSQTQNLPNWLDPGYTLIVNVTD